MTESFKKQQKTELTELNGTLHEYQHESGARLFWLETKDDNKLFSVTFKTVPEDSTGVFHILEHCVFCGSNKFPIKDPFLYLAKGSMNTFLNAMTFLDHTSYPVSSRNEKDFHNLVSVYLDAVFCPAIYENKSIFHQEGWHYELAEDGNSAFVNGVVYNEMKGVESSVEEKLNTEMLKLLYPNTCYRFVSGGSTDEIPTLSYDMLIAAHKRFYRPDNAVFYLEGNLDIEATLEQIEEYLYSPTEELNIPKIEMQEEITPSASQISYPLGADEDLENKTHILMGKRLCEYSDLKKVYATMMVCDYLTSSLEAPLAQVILENQLGQDIRMFVDKDVKQPYMCLNIVNTEASNEPIIKDVMVQLKDAILESGCLNEGLEPIITNLEFKNRELEEPRALIHSMSAATSVLYDADVADYFQVAKVFQELRELLKTDYYEKILAEILNPENLSTVIAIPSYDNDVDNTIVVPATDEIKEDNQKLIEWQITPDTEDAISTLPKLSLSDVDSLPKDNSCKEIVCDGVKVLLHKAPISDMAYLNVYFPVPAKYADRLSDVSLLGNMLLNLPTEQYAPMELYQKKQSVLGDLTFEFVQTADVMNDDESKTYFVARASYLKNSVNEAIKFICEVIYHTLYEDETFAENILLQLSDAYRNASIENGHSLGMMKALGSWSSANGATELIEGLSCYDNIKNILGKENGIIELLCFLKELSYELFTKKEMILGITVPEGENPEDYGIGILLSNVPNGTDKECVMHINLPREDKVIPIPANISYATSGIYEKPEEIAELGVRQVVSNIASLEYLWTEIRMRGGAYGAGMKAGTNGNISFYSYRDPNPDNSNKVYKQCSEFIKEFSNSDADLESYIIGAIANSEPLLSPKNESFIAEKNYLNGLSYTDLCEIRKGMLETTNEKLLDFATNLSVFEKQYTDCTIKMI